MGPQDGRNHSFLLEYAQSAGKGHSVRRGYTIRPCHRAVDKITGFYLEERTETEDLCKLPAQFSDQLAFFGNHVIYVPGIYLLELEYNVARLLASKDVEKTRDIR